ncbi:OmpH family outer membrane protein [Roseovarius spongiae]|uniref:OmpH family outer membrane protein n=1 Tax=Roseovarius spongiae TaxID=2320272 RepID=A0A3A8B9Y8_9RHOB|nr:OmpH family outer membrane protein [Roseovarius spongiae]RKF15255.1 OmpH family outer membrane protein [Roseovarius spongiae]
MRRLAQWACRVAFIAIAAGAAPAPGGAQDIGTVQSDILVIDTERFFQESRAGQRITQEYQAERDRLIANNRRIEAELRAEEQALTDKRPTVTPEEFRDMADAFDEKVRGIRQANEREARDLERRREVAPLQLMQMAEPVLVQIMRDAGAIIVLDHRQVLLRADVIDITDLAIARVDEVIGDGRDVDADDAGGSDDDNSSAPAEESAPTPEFAPGKPAEPENDSARQSPETIIPDADATRSE